MKYFIITYGCQANKSDSERISAFLEVNGYFPAQTMDGAALILISACSVRQSAIDRIWGQVREIKKLENKNKKIKTALTGCILKEDKKKFSKHFDYIFDIRDLQNWQRILQKDSTSLTRPWHNYRYTDYWKVRPKYHNNFSAFVPISNGCDNACAYCVVPRTRGPLVCRDHKDILKETGNLVNNEFKEIWLLGQNVNNYQSPSDPSFNFPKLLASVNKIKGDFWIRFTSPHPKDFSDKLIETMAKLKKVTPYLNLPVQAGNNEVLKKMNRPYTAERYKKLVKKIRSTFKKYRRGLEKNIALSTDIIVGFPTETEKKFQNTAGLMKELKYDMAYISQYSPRPGTAAEKLKDNVPKKEKEKRWKILDTALRESALEKSKEFIGKNSVVLVENQKNDFLIGKNRHYKTVHFKGPRDLIGKFVDVKIINAGPFGLKGKLL